MQLYSSFWTSSFWVCIKLEVIRALFISHLVTDLPLDLHQTKEVTMVSHPMVVVIRGSSTTSNTKEVILAKRPIMEVSLDNSFMDRRECPSELTFDSS